jgi:uncharacterized protein (TIGR02588 family)
MANARDRDETDTGGAQPRPDRSRQSDPAPAAPGTDRPRGRTPAEWTTFAVSVLVVLAVVGAALVEQLLIDEPAGTRLSVTVAADRAARRDDRYYVPFTVANDGATPASDVTLVFEVRRGDTLLEESTADVPFLPVRASEDGLLVTAFDPATHEILARVATLHSP